MKTALISLFSVLMLSGISGSAHAQNAPSGWVKSETGITKGKSKVTIGEVQKLDGQSAVEFMSGLENTPPEGTEFVSSGGIKDGKYVVQIKREITVEGIKARSVLMLCNGGANKHRLLEIFSENSKVLDLISGAKYAIAVCAK